jgi:hypothetical protein
MESVASTPAKEPVLTVHETVTAELRSGETTTVPVLLVATMPAELAEVSPVTVVVAFWGSEPATVNVNVPPPETVPLTL